MHQKMKTHLMLVEDSRQLKHIKVEAATILASYKSSNWTEHIAVFARLRNQMHYQMVECLLHVERCERKYTEKAEHSSKNRIQNK